MPDALANPVWEVVAAVGVVLAVLAAVVSFVLELGRKRLSYELLAVTPLAGAQQGSGQDVELRFRGEVVHGAAVVEVRIAVIGNVPIEPGDFQIPLSVGLGQGAQILVAEVARAEPADMQARVSIQDNRAVLAPLLLHGKDSLVIRILAAGWAEPVDVDVNAQLVGMKGVERARGREWSPGGLAFWGLGMGSIAGSVVALVQGQYGCAGPLALVSFVWMLLVWGRVVLGGRKR